MRIKSLTHINNGIPPKVQGQTIRSKIVFHLGKEEKEHGLKYTAFSRATRFGNVGIYNGYEISRLSTKIRWHPNISARLSEERRFDQMVEETSNRYRNYFRDDATE